MVENNNNGGTYQIDSLCVIENGREFLLNTNDCPFPIAKDVIKSIKSKFNKIDFMLVGYTSASLFPFSMIDYDDVKKEKARLLTQKKALNFAINYIEFFKPKFFMPHAGTYYLGGKNWDLNKFSSIPEYSDAKIYIENILKTKEINSRCIILNQGKTFDLNNSENLPLYVIEDKTKREEYIKNELSKIKFTYEDNNEIILAKNLIEKFKKAWFNFLNKISNY